MNNTIRKLGYLETLVHQLDVNVVFLVSFSCVIDLQKLKSVLERIKKKHALLEVTISQKDGVCYFSELKTLLPVQELKDYSLDLLIDQQLNYSFKEDELLYNVFLLRKDKGDLLLFTFDHTISDARSASECIRDLIYLYFSENNITFPIEEAFPHPIETYALHYDLRTNDFLDAADPCIESNKNVLYKKKQVFSFDGFDIPASKILQIFEVASLSSVLSGLAIKTYSDVINQSDLSRHLNADLRPALEINDHRLACYSVGVTDFFQNISDVPLNLLIKQVQKSLFEIFKNKASLKKSIFEKSEELSAISISDVRNKALLDLERNPLINNIQIFGNCFHAREKGKRIFVIFTKFKHILNVSISYDTRNFSEIEMTSFIHIFSKNIQNIFTILKQ